MISIDSPIADLARAIIIAQTDLDDALSALDEIIDHLIECADQIDDLNAATIMNLARMIDPTESHFAAAIRDAIRDNTDHALI